MTAPLLTILRHPDALVLFLVILAALLIAWWIDRRGMEAHP